MRKTTLMAALAAATMITSPAMAGNAEGKWQVKVLGTGVLPDGKITSASATAGTTLGDAVIALSPGVQSKANDNIVPTLAVEYFFSPAVSVETICCFTQHHVSAAGTLPAGSLVDHVLILPATVTAKYHLNAGPIRPYIGAGPALFMVFGEKPGALARSLGSNSVHLSDELGVVAQAGVDIPVNDTGMGISLDAKKYWINTTATFKTAAGVTSLKTKHQLDPWVLSGGVYFRF